MNFVGIPGYPNSIPLNVIKVLPKFSGENFESAYQHARNFSDLMCDYGVEDEDVIMRLFIRSLIGDAREWLSCLPDNDISSWDDLVAIFLVRFAEKVNDFDMLKALMDMQMEEDELVPSFNARFIKT